ncbi:hypothetical protein ACP70R_030857 [Stipagrostis hirtigluma subsp. patula]
MHQDNFRSVVCRSLSKSLASRSKDGSYPETVQCDVPCVVTLQPSVCRGCQGQKFSPSQSYREERSMSLHRDYLMAPSLSKHFAEDLLRGAMDLQESLAMLERFQAASQSMRHSNKKRRPESGEKSPEIDAIVREVLLRPSSGKQILNRPISNGLLSQSNNSTDKLKSVVKDGLYKKNIVPVSYNNEQASLCHSTRYLPNNCLMSKTTQQKKEAPRSFSSYAEVQPDKSKSPSLVAKLMGLDGLPTHNDNSIVKDEKIKTVSSPRARFDIEMPKSKRLLPHILGEESRFGTEMPRSEKLPPEHQNVPTNYNCSQKSILPSYGTITVNEIGSMKSDEYIDRAQAKSLKEIKVVSPTSSKQQTKETTKVSRPTREIRKSRITERDREGRKDVKAKVGPASRTAKTAKMPDRKFSASSSSQTGNSRKPILQKSPNNSRGKKVSRRNVRSSTVNEIVVSEIQREIAHALDHIDGPSTEHSATPSDESCQSADWDVESSIGDTGKDFSESSKALLSTSHAERMSLSDGYAIQPSTDRISAEEAEIKDEISLLLLSDQSFLWRAAELIGIGASEHLTNQYKAISKVEIEHPKLYLDIAAEQLERKHRQQDSLCYTGHQGQKCRAATYFSLQALLRDISSGIRKLSGYTDNGACNTKDGLIVKLERDLWCTDALINGVWEMGWQDWMCMEETECFIRDAGEDILSLLIEEAALDMWIH